jgi:hypothetical protein
MATTIQTTASTVTVNAAFLQEIKEVNAELWQLLDNLRDTCQMAVGVREHSALLCDMLIELRDQLALHFALEEAYGYFEDPQLVVPAMAQEAARLRSEHRELYALANGLADEAEMLLFDGKLAEFVTRVPKRFRELDQKLQQHEAYENDLIMQQFEDIGVGD